MIMVSERIKRLREKKGLTQKQLAEIIRVDQSTVAKWEKGEKTPKTENVIKMAAAFDVDISELMNFKKADGTYNETDFKCWLQDINFRDHATAGQVEILEKLDRMPDNLKPLQYWTELIKALGGKKGDINFLIDSGFKDLLHEFQELTKGQMKYNIIKNDKKQRSKLLDCAKNMPPIGGKEDVLKWISQQENLCEWVFNKLKDSGYIAFNRDTTETSWIGTEYQNDNEK
ncbi:helix-turn-helix domain-containing protein [Eubacterium sp.]|uniref:helix-turn-helix domain-containing protein n=1 Tax=Eubacterium sp. TaxID=142586 RepID=UPI003999D56B